MKANSFATRATLRVGHLTYAPKPLAQLPLSRRGLQSSGIAKGERVVFWGENRPEWIVALWACLLQGVVAVPVDFRSSSALAGKIAGIVDAKALLIGDGLTAPAEIGCPVWPMRMALETSDRGKFIRSRFIQSGTPGRTCRDPLHLRRDR